MSQPWQVKLAEAGKLAFQQVNCSMLADCFQGGAAGFAVFANAQQMFQGLVPHCMCAACGHPRLNRSKLAHYAGEH